MIKTYRIVFGIALLSFIGFGQTKKADRYFKEGDFIKAASLYEEAYTKEPSKKIVQQLIHCYYNTYQYEPGLKAMKKLINGEYQNKNKHIDARFNFKYSQFLAATGDYEKSITQLKGYKETMGQKTLNVEDAKEMAETFRLKKADFNITKANFNSSASDFSAVKFKDTIYFSSDRIGGTSQAKFKWTHRPFLDIFMVVADTTLPSKTNTPKALPNIINSNLHEASLCFTKDGNTMYFSRSNQENGKKIFNANGQNQIQLYVSKKVENQWLEPKKLSFCSSDYNYQHPSLSADERTLFYATDEIGTIGDFDIYKVSLKKDGTFDSPKNLGNKVNTLDREQYPFVAKDGNLFFSSNGHLGLGLLDVFVSELKNNTYQHPINLGAPINSRYDDFSLSYSDKKEGYFSSNRDSINDDIFEFKQIGPLFDREYVTTFVIKDSISLIEVPDANITLIDKLGNNIYENTLDILGEFTTNLIPGIYTIEVSAPGFKSKTASIAVKNKNKEVHLILIEKLFDVAQFVKNNSDASKKNLAKILKDQRDPKINYKDGKLYFAIEKIYFDFDRWHIREDSKKTLHNLITKLKDYPSLKIKINAHTDSYGTDGYNKLLSEKRAQSTRDYIVNNGGIKGDKIRFKGYGESKPLVNCAANCSFIEHQKNRRSEFEIIEY